MSTCDEPLPSDSVGGVSQGVTIVIYVCIGVVGVIGCIVGLVMCCKKSVPDNDHLLQNLSSMSTGTPNEGEITESRSDIPSVDGGSTYSAPQSV
jgi:hypothetical protein